MSGWLFDLGNTRLKSAESRTDGSLGEVRAAAHDDGDGWLRDLPRGDAACIASVASSERRVALLDALCTRFGRIHLVRTQARCAGLRIAYGNPRHLGVDRFLALLSALENGEVLLAGIGTALTIDLLDGDGLHRGGRIAPSPMLMREALHARAAVLPETGGEYAEFADDTPELVPGNHRSLDVGRPTRFLVPPEARRMHRCSYRNPEKAELRTS